MEYYPLNTDRNEIRFLTLLPTGSDETTIVRCSLEHVSLINPPEYRALSYCWGDPTVTTEIIINKTPVQVTTNLESALRHLRDKGYTCFWVDAICINQQDDDEKNQQLVWMGSIYRRAKVVEAWIGEEDNDSDGVFDAISTESFDFANHSNVAKLMRFLERPYWRRVWVIQELALARQTLVHCGRRDISWETLASVVQSDTLNDPSPALANVRNLVRFHHDASSIKPLRLVEALSRSCSSLATDPRDKVFALLGLVYDSNYYIPVPNYKQSLRDLCITMALSAVSTTFSLDVIVLLASGCNNSSGLPSWTPNWFRLKKASSKRQSAYIIHGVPMSSPESAYKFHPKERPWYHVSGNTRASVLMHSDVLQLRGYIFDEVDGVCPTLLEVEGKFQFLREWQSTSEGKNHSRHLWRDIVHTLTRYWAYPALLRADFPWSNCEYFGLCWREETIRNWRDSARAQTISWILEVGSFVVQGRTLKELAMENTDNFTWQGSPMDNPANGSFRIGGYYRGELYSYRDEKLESTLQDTEAALKDNMRFMTTKKGNVGWAHPRSKKGDMICILEGCTVPVILRARANGDFVLVGASYVHGIMEGQEMERDTKVDWIEIKIH